MAHFGNTSGRENISDKTARETRAEALLDYLKEIRSHFDQYEAKDTPENERKVHKEKIEELLGFMITILKNFLKPRKPD